MRRIFLLIFSLFLFTGLTYVQRMSDEQVVEYVKGAQATGKSQKQITHRDTCIYCDIINLAIKINNEF